MQFDVTNYVFNIVKRHHVLRILCVLKLHFVKNNLTFSKMISNLSYKNYQTISNVYMKNYKKRLLTKDNISTIKHQFSKCRQNHKNI
jgi:hypothetical protein